MRSPLARDRRQPPGFIRPARPVLSAVVPTGDGWLHELKHDGFRIIVHRDGDDVRLWSRNGRFWSVEFVAITAAVMALPFARIEAWKACPDFHALLGRSAAATACLYAFDLLHVGRDDLRRLELVERRALLRKYLRGAEPALLYSEHMEGTRARRCSVTPAASDSKASCRSASRAATGGRCLSWVKVKNPGYERR